MKYMLFRIYAFFLISYEFLKHYASGTLLINSTSRAFSSKMRRGMFKVAKDRTDNAFGREVKINEKSFRELIMCE